MNERQTGEMVTSRLRAGVAKSDITVRDKNIKVNDPLFAKALVIDDGATKLVIIAMDVTAIGGIGDVSDAFMGKLRGRIQKELNIPGPNVLVNASHTHPPGRLLCDDEQQVERTFDAVRRATANMTPVTIGSGVGHEDRITVNRTLKMKDGKAWTVRHANPCPPDENVADMAPIDPQIGVLRIDRLDGRPFAVVYNFACHLLFNNPQGKVTADFPGVASKIIEENLGPDVMALFLQGAGGDIIDRTFKNFDQVRTVEPFGMMLGLSTLKAVRNIKTDDAKLNIINETVKLPRRTDSLQRIEELEREQAELIASLRFTALNFKTFLPMYLKYALNPDYPLDYPFAYIQAQRTGATDPVGMDALNRGNIEKYLHNIRAMERLARIQDRIETFKRHKAINDESGETMIDAEVQGIKIGDCVLITSTTEVLTEVSLNIKKASPYQHTFVIAFTNGYIHYGPPAHTYDKGGYEVTECLLGPQWQEIYEQKAAEIIRRL